jgi:hypothetical protein
LRPSPTPTRRSPLEKQRAYGVFRTTLITYGAGALTYLLAKHDAGTLSSRVLLLCGVVLQLLLIGLRALVKRYVPDAGSAAQASMMLELVGDGVTVLLFALGTFGAITHGADDL